LAKATLAPLLKKQDGYIRWEESARTIHNRVRAFLPWPSVVVGFRGAACRILRTALTDPAPAGESGPNAGPGTIAFDRNTLEVLCGDGRWIQIVQLHLADRKPVSGGDFARGVRLQPEDRFDVFDPPPSK
jgi:methionyl-tRNA formyltransferase